MSGISNLVVPAQSMPHPGVRNAHECPLTTLPAHHSLSITLLEFTIVIRGKLLGHFDLFFGITTSNKLYDFVTAIHRKVSTRIILDSNRVQAFIKPPIAVYGVSVLRVA